MFKLLFLCLIVRATVFSNEIEGSSDMVDDEDGNVENADVKHLDYGGNSDKSRANNKAGVMPIILGVTVPTVVLVLSGIVGVFLLNRHKHNRHQGMYAVPAEQPQKGTV